VENKWKNKDYLTLEYTLFLDSELIIGFCSISKLKTTFHGFKSHWFSFWYQKLLITFLMLVYH